MKKIFARRFCQDSNSQPIDHESGSLPTKLSRLIVHGMMLLSFIYNCLQLEIAFCLFFVTSFDGMYYLEWIQNWLKQIPSDEDDLDRKKCILQFGRPRASAADLHKY